MNQWDILTLKFPKVSSGKWTGICWPGGGGGGGGGEGGVWFDGGGMGAQKCLWDGEATQLRPHLEEPCCMKQLKDHRNF